MWSVVRWTTWCVAQKTFDLERVEPLSSPISATPQPTTCTTSVWEVHCVRVSVGVIGVQASWRGRGMRRCCVFVLIVLLLLWILSPFRPSATLRRSEEHTSELQSLMRISYAVFCLKKKTRKN